MDDEWPVNLNCVGTTAAALALFVACLCSVNRVNRSRNDTVGEIAKHRKN